MMHSGILPALALLQFGGGATGSLSPLLIQIVLILGIFYFFLIRPQQQQRKKQEETLRGIKRGDRVVTSGGIIGEVVHIREVTTGEGATPRPMEDEITIKSGDSTRLVVERGKIARVGGGPGASTKE
jgi:preprotein translocase subunit YajC